MTICATEDATAPARPHRATLTIAADGSYAARLARHDDAAGSWFPERWTLSGPEPYAVPLQGTQPEEPDSALLPLADGRVLIARRVAGRFAVSLLYPAGPGTGELLLGAVEAPELTLLPPAPDGTRGYALAPGAQRTTLWLLHGGAGGPEPVAEIPGRCSGGVWLDRAGRLLALDRQWAGRTKAITVDLERGGETGPLLQITEDSNDRLLLADPDSGLLLVRSDAPGQDRLGWGVLGSRLPVRFPECLHPVGATVTPFAMQPRQMLAPESCAVAFRMDGAHGTWLGVWRPSVRQLRQFPAPQGWLTGAGLWTAHGELLLPYATAAEPCGVARVASPVGVVETPRVVVPEGPVRTVAPERPVRRAGPERAVGAVAAEGSVRTVAPERQVRVAGPERAVGAVVPERPVRMVARERPAGAMEPPRVVVPPQPVRAVESPQQVRTMEPPQQAWAVEPARAVAPPVERVRLVRPVGPMPPMEPVRLPAPPRSPWKLVGPLRPVQGPLSGPPSGLPGAMPAEAPSGAYAGAEAEADARTDTGPDAGADIGAAIASGTAPGARLSTASTPENDGGIVPDTGETDNRSTSSAQPCAVAGEPQPITEHPPLCRPVPLQQAPLAAR
ncbi:hypothetical protein BX264_1956 [Streptomyces sp. 2333.5]|uniref:hypothetical protein n=1 Tax=unclassified Streptomyces TaxID=2593676 RepID=UPI00089994F9|nr:hypothetical protein BX264_1956 [Streptomyces sp. 2333.5]SEC73079.1 hypothetical protein SAMN05428943_2099 [Streptomyces sp. 2314.4]SED52209.1 hypothetical protein SAMN05428942_1972 [Streptomyces sp. 2112.2]